MKIKRIMSMVLSLSILLGTLTVNAVGTGRISDTFKTKDGPIAGMTVTLYNKDEHGVSSNKIDETVTNENGVFSFSNLDTGLYNVRYDESKYKITNTSDQTEYDTYKGIAVSVSSGNTSLLTKKPTLEALKGNIVLTKYETGSTTTIPNAEYEIYKKSDLETVIGTGITDDNGKIEFKDLLYDDYVIKEKSSPNGYFLNENPIDVSLNKTKIEVNAYDDSICNVKLIKKDYNDVLLSNAIYDLYRIGTVDAKIGTYETNENGEINLDLREGNYYFLESKAPDGYEISSEKINFTLDKTNKTKTVYGIDNAIHYTIYIQKVDSNDNTIQINGAELELYKKNANGDDKLITRWRTTGEKEISGLEAGEYYVKETYVPEGYELINQTTPIILNEGTTPKYDENNEEIKYKYLIENKKIENVKLQITKTDEDGNSLAGAHLQLLDSQNNVLADWISTTLAKEVTVTYGETYTLKELSAPDRYIKKDDVTIKINRDFENKMREDDNWDGIYRFTMKNSKSQTYTLAVNKKDSSRNDLNGARLQLLDKQNNVIDEWTTASTHIIYDLREGTYTLKEIKAPDGYVKADDIQIKIGPDIDIGYNGKTMRYEYTMLDKDVSVTIEKRDKETNEFLKGAILALYQGEEEKYRFTTNETGYTINNIVPGEYTLKEITVPTGYKKADDMTIQIEEKESQKFVMYDEKAPVDVSISKVDGYSNALLAGAKLTMVDKDGNAIDTWTSEEKEHIIEDVKLGRYTIKELEAPEGYEKINDMIFEVTETNHSIIVKNYTTVNTIDVTVNKIDGNTEKALSGAKLSVVDEKGNAIDTWTSDGKSHIIKDVKYGKYTIKELTPPDGYVKADNLMFEVSPTNHEITIKNYKNKVYIYKYEEGTKDFVEGARLTIEDKDGNEIDSWKTKDERHEVTGLKAGETYILIEEKAPSGYEKAKDIEFKIEKDESSIKIKMYDKKITATEKVYESQSATEIPAVTSKGEIVATGDSSNLLLYGILGITSLSVLILLYFKKKNK